MQYGLRIIFETELSHKTKNQMTGLSGQKTDVQGKGEHKTGDFEFRFRNGEGEVCHTAQGPSPKVKK